MNMETVLLNHVFQEKSVVRAPRSREGCLIMEVEYLQAGKKSLE